MKRALKATGATLLGLIVIASGGGSIAAQEAEFTPLFNGEDLTGWTDTLDNGSMWGVRNNVLEGTGGGLGKPALLVSDRADFTDFTLRVVFRHQANGGGAVEVRRTGSDQSTDSYFVSTCVKGNAELGTGPAGRIMKMRAYHYGTGTVTPTRRAEETSIGANEWHTLDVFVVGNRVTSFVDGQQVHDHIDGKKPHTTGGITLFCRGDSTIELRQVLIREAKPAEETLAAENPAAP